MSSIQIGALVYFTLITIGAWIFFGVIFLQLKRFMDMSCYVPIISRVLTIIMICLTLIGYIIIFSPPLFEMLNSSTTVSNRPAGYFDTY